MKAALMYIACCSLLVLAACGSSTAVDDLHHPQNDPLPSWNDGPLKQSIIAYVKEIADTGSRNFIPIIDRIATFDNDGTLWAQQPLVQELFMFYRIKKMAKADPRLQSKQPYKAFLTHDSAYLSKLSEKDIVRLFVSTQTGMTEREYKTDAADFFATAKYPGNKMMRQVTYQPQVELLNFLRENGFKTFICSGGSVEFMRVISQQYYGIPAEQVIGSEFNSAFKDSAGFDEAREFAYTEKDNISLDWAKKYNWHVVSMKNDWKVVFVK